VSRGTDLGVGILGLAQLKSKRVKLTRIEKSEETRKALFDAAAKIVGKHGYEGASIARITSRAKVAQGTFYNYFTTRQDLLDQLLPEMGDLMLEYLRVHMSTEAKGWQREEERLRAYFSFLEENPWFHRLVNEAETLAPKAHKVYFSRISAGYVRSLRRAIKVGEIKNFDESDLEPLSYMLMSMRTYLAQRYAYANGSVRAPDAQIIRTYVKLVRFGLYAD
jgi:AcrR family transcriptional regulator